MPHHMNFIAHEAMPPSGRLLATINPHSEGNLVITYQYSDPKMTQAALAAALEADLARLGTRLRRVDLQLRWSYFPHVLGPDLDAGFFARLDALQGDRGTYYTGGAAWFETIAHVMKGSEVLMGRFFGDRAA